MSRELDCFREVVKEESALDLLPVAKEIIFRLAPQSGLALQMVVAQICTAIVCGEIWFGGATRYIVETPSVHLDLCTLCSQS